MAGAENGLRQRNVNGAASRTVTPTDEGKKRDQELDQHVEYVPFSALHVCPAADLRPRYDFGGPWGVVSIMTGFPILMYYLWICLVFYDGSLVHPSSVDDVQPFLWRMWEHIRVVSRPYLCCLYCA